MKKLKVGIILLSVFIFLLSAIISYSNNFVTERQNYLSANDENVSTRELAMLASLVYEDVPNDYIYKYPLTRSLNDEENNGCVSENGTLKNKKCFFSQKDEMVKLKNSKENYKVKQYIEGMSERKAKSVVNVLTDAYEEDGQEYYFLNFANVKELEGKWTIFDYKSDTKRKKDPDNVSWNNAFDAITFKKGNNYVIAFRGTDYPDLYEWITDVLYSINGQNSQSMKAYNYAKEAYDKIIKDNSNAKIYVTGHSLGAYLAQIGGAAIVDKEASITESPETREVLKASSLEDYKKDYNISNSHLEQVAYFNGMGVTPIFVSNKFATNINNSLIYLSTHDKNGSVATSDRTVNYSDDIKSSGRLVLYSITGDPISDIGFHFGEIYKLEYGADAVTNHENHSFKTLIDSAKSKLDSIKGKKISELTAEDIKNLIESIKADSQKFTEGLSKIVSLGVDLNDVIKNSKNNQSGELMPQFIKAQNSLYNDYSPLLNLGNVLNDAISYASKDNTSSILSVLKNNEAIKAFGLLEYANVNHETDSFTCLIDSDNGKIKQDSVDFKVETVNMNCKNEICNYTPSKYASDYKVNDNLSKYDDKEYIKLSAKVTKGCAKSYVWRYSYDGKKYATITFGDYKNYVTTTYKNEIIIPKDQIETMISSPDNKDGKIYFMVSVYYGDTYSQRKANISYDETFKKNKLTYRTVKEYKENPTLIDNKGNVSSDSGTTSVFGESRYYYVTDTPKGKSKDSIILKKAN